MKECDLDFRVCDLYFFENVIALLSQFLITPNNNKQVALVFEF
jgi:hypothetical protein